MTEWPQISGETQAAPEGWDKGWGHPALIVVAGVIGLIVLLNSLSGETKTDDPRQAVANSSSSDKTIWDRMPPEERSFITVIETYKDQYDSASNGMQKGAARVARARDLCSMLGGSKSANNWKGKIYKLSSNSDGYGVVEIALADEIYVTTWNNSISDFADHTLIDPNGSLYSRVYRLEEGQWVTFSGSFRPASSDCLKEASVGQAGAMTEPEFIFKFSGISRIE